MSVHLINSDYIKIGRGGVKRITHTSFATLSKEQTMAKKRLEKKLGWESS